MEVIHKDLLRLHVDLQLIKNVLFNEGKLTPWAKKELSRARAEGEESYTSLDEL